MYVKIKSAGSCAMQREELPYSYDFCLQQHSGPRDTAYARLDCCGLLHSLYQLSPALEMEARSSQTRRLRVNNKGRTTTPPPPPPPTPKMQGGSGLTITTPPFTYIA